MNDDVFDFSLGTPAPPDEFGVVVHSLPPAHDPTEVFWIIWNPDYHKPPIVRFTNRKAAEYAAKGMADRFYPDRFYVCRALGSAIGEPRTVNFERVTK